MIEVDGAVAALEQRETNAVDIAVRLVAVHRLIKAAPGPALCAARGAIWAPTFVRHLGQLAVFTRAPISTPTIGAPR